MIFATNWYVMDEIVFAILTLVHWFLLVLFLLMCMWGLFYAPAYIHHRCLFECIGISWVVFVKDTISNEHDSAQSSAPSVA